MNQSNNGCTLLIKLLICLTFVFQFNLKDIYHFFMVSYSCKSQIYIFIIKKEKVINFFKKKRNQFLS